MLKENIQYHQIYHITVCVSVCLTVSPSLCSQEEMQSLSSSVRVTHCNVKQWLMIVL